MKRFVVGLVALLCIGAAFAISVSAGWVSLPLLTGESSVSVATSPCPETSDEQEVLNKSMVRITSFWRNNLQHRGPYQGLGFIVDGHYILTADHVVAFAKGYTREIYIEKLPISSPPHLVKVENVIVERPDVDFALLELPKAFSRSYLTNAFPIADQKDILRGTETCFFLRPYRGVLKEEKKGVVTRWAPPRGTWAWFGIQIDASLFETLPGASGGAVFIRINGQLKIAGIARSVQRQEDDFVTQVSATDASYVADVILQELGIDIARPSRP